MTKYNNYQQLKIYVDMSTWGWSGAGSWTCVNRWQQGNQSTVTTLHLEADKIVLPEWLSHYVEADSYLKQWVGKYNFLILYYYL